MDLNSREMILRIYIPLFSLEATTEGKICIHFKQILSSKSTFHLKDF